jgi:hypothetical protein
MKARLCAIIGLLLAGSVAFAAETTWTGVISDSHCGAVHRSDVEHGGKITARECIIGQVGNPNIPGCVSAKHGATFVLAVGDKVYNITNQDFADLRVHAADTVKLTGTLKGDAITVSKIVKATR